jgi:hypothetical protein
MKNKLVWLPRMVAVAFAMLAIFTYFDHCTRYFNAKDEMKDFVQNIGTLEQKGKELENQKQVLVSDLGNAEVKTQAKKRKWKKKKEKVFGCFGQDTTISEPIKEEVVTAFNTADSVIAVQDTVIMLQKAIIALQDTQLANKDSILANKDSIIGVQAEALESQEKALKKQHRKKQLNNFLLSAAVITMFIFAVR